MFDACGQSVGAVDCDGAATWPDGGGVNAADGSGAVISSGPGMDGDGPEDTAWLYVAHHGDRIAVLRVLAPTGSVLASGDGGDRTPGCLAGLLDIRTTNGTAAPPDAPEQSRDHLTTCCQQTRPEPDQPQAWRIS